jgi:hypothetical protein
MAPGNFPIGAQFHPRKIGLTRKLQKSSWKAAPFLLQMPAFSCRDAHAFNNKSSAHLLAAKGSGFFSQFSAEKLSLYSLFLPSFLPPPQLVVLASFAGT